MVQNVFGSWYFLMKSCFFYPIALCESVRFMSEDQSNNLVLSLMALALKLRKATIYTENQTDQG